MSEMFTFLKNNINQPIICADCEKEFFATQDPKKSLQDFTKVDVGLTDFGVQIWCQRHQKNICHFDFEGIRIKADFRCLNRKKTH
tara:strand:+ start:252 stop:506 length:255 start_codon:yes stop_codon:yes gene_type:complete